MEQVKPEQITKPILATLLSGVLPGLAGSSDALTLFRQLASSSAGGAEVEQVDEALVVFGEACVTFSDPQRAMDWLTQPSSVFGGKAPFAMLHSPDGRSAVKEQLIRIEHGIFQ